MIMWFYIKNLAFEMLKDLKLSIIILNTHKNN